MNKSLSNKPELLIVGSVAYDTIKTPFGKINQALGGSASYSSLSASLFTKPAIVAVVGKDFLPKDKNILKKAGADLSGLKTTAGKTFAWGGEYGFDLNSRTTLFTHLGVFENFSPILSEAQKNSEYLFLGNIHPALQLDVLSQVKRPKLVALDSMNLWIQQTKALLLKAAAKTDVFIINDSECRQLSGEHNLIKAAKKIQKQMKKNSALIIKQGEYGLLMFGEGKIFHLPGYPLEDVIDPTGAGDSFAGGFMGYVSASGDLSFNNFKKACVAGSVVASFCVEDLGTKKLAGLKQKDLLERFKNFKTLTHFDT